MVITLFSGLEQSVTQQRWKPTGAPTIYRLVEALDNRAELVLWFTTRQGANASGAITLSPLRAKVRLLARPAVPAWFGRVGWYVAELSKAWRVWRDARAAQPDIVYVDRGNLWIAGILARWSRVPVVYRVMGISDHLRASLAGRRPRHLIDRWMLRAPFAAVVCTQDGSGGEGVLKRLLRPSVPQYHLVNGVDWRKEAATLGALSSVAPGKVTILFAGRLESMKGADEFLDAFLTARAHAPGRMHALILGEGSQGHAMRARVRGASAEDDVIFLGAVEHDRVASVYQRADVYVSLNKMGNLSNTTLEALSFGCCCVMPEPDDTIPRDAVTRQLLPEGTVVRIPAIDDLASLATTLLELSRDTARRQAVAARGREAARSFVPSWTERIDVEVALLRELVAPGDGARAGQLPPSESRSAR